MPSTPVKVCGAVIGTPSSVSCALGILLVSVTTDVRGLNVDGSCVGEPLRIAHGQNEPIEDICGCLAAVCDRERSARDAAGLGQVADECGSS